MRPLLQPGMRPTPAWRAAALAAASALLAGCAVPNGAAIAGKGRDDLAAAPVCCAHLSTVTVGDLPREKIKVTVDEKRQAFEFDGTKAFFVAYRLPDFSDTYAIVISTENAGTALNTAMFMPRVALYDADWKRTRVFDETTLRPRGTGSLERTVFINPPNADERYLVVYGSNRSDVKELAMSAVTSQPITVGAATIYWQSGADTKVLQHSAPVGDFIIETQGLVKRR